MNTVNDPVAVQQQSWYRCRRYACCEQMRTDVYACFCILLFIFSSILRIYLFSLFTKYLKYSYNAALGVNGWAFLFVHNRSHVHCEAL